jgi:diguanylate cyclase (GGDEF)-like protein
VFLTAHTDTETVQQVFMAGADDFVTKPIVVPELINCMTTRIQHHRLWQKLAERDSLTHLTTHNKFTQDLCRLLQTASQQPVTLVLLKINQLKSINHDYGHQVGDDVLRWVGTLLNQQTAPEDLTARWSGNKFAIALHGVTGNQAIHRLSHLIQALREREFKTLDQPPLTLTVSTGLAHYPEDGRTLQALYQTAENRLAGSPL